MFTTTDLSDAHPDLAVLAPILRPFGARTTFYGPIQTVKVFEDNVLVVKALETVDPGSVLVIDGGGSTGCALVGDRLAAIAVGRRLGGIVVNGCVRDSAQLAAMDIGILALAASPRRSRKEGAGERDVPVEFGGVRFSPHHHIYADADGVIVSPLRLISGVPT